MHDRGLSTVIGKDVDATGRAVSSSTRETFNRLRIWDQRSRTRSSSSLAKALTILNATKTKLGIPSPILEDAASIYRKAVSAKLTRGRTMQSLVAASLYAACRRTGTPRSLDDVAGAANVAKRVLSRDLRMLIRSLDMDLNQYDTSAFVVRLANNLNLRERIKRDALDILARSEGGENYGGEAPCGAGRRVAVSVVHYERGEDNPERIRAGSGRKRRHHKKQNGTDQRDSPDALVAPANLP